MKVTNLNSERRTSVNNYVCCTSVNLQFGALTGDQRKAQFDVMSELHLRFINLAMSQRI